MGNKIVKVKENHEEYRNSKCKKQLKIQNNTSINITDQGRDSAPSPNSPTFYPRLRHRPHLKAWFWFMAWQRSYYGTAPVELAGNMSSKM